jgi:hypothetical protein
MNWQKTIGVALCGIIPWAGWEELSASEPGRVFVRNQSAASYFPCTKNKAALKVSDYFLLCLHSLNRSSILSEFADA